MNGLIHVTISPLSLRTVKSYLAPKTNGCSILWKLMLWFVYISDVVQVLLYLAIPTVVVVPVAYQHVMLGICFELDVSIREEDHSRAMAFVSLLPVYRVLSILVNVYVDAMALLLHPLRDPEYYLVLLDTKVIDCDLKAMLLISLTINWVDAPFATGFIEFELLYVLQSGDIDIRTLKMNKKLTEITLF